MLHGSSSSNPYPFPGPTKITSHPSFHGTMISSIRVRPSKTNASGPTQIGSHRNLLGKFIRSICVSLSNTNASGQTHIASHRSLLGTLVQLSLCESLQQKTFLDLYGPCDNGHGNHSHLSQSKCRFSSAKMLDTGTDQHRYWILVHASTGVGYGYRQARIQYMVHIL